MYKNIIIGKKVVLFDLDGTIVNNEPMWQLAFSNVMSREGIYLEAYKELVRASGVPNSLKWNSILQTIQPKSGKTSEQLTKDTSDEYLKILEDSEMETRDGFWDLVFFLKQEKGFKLGLVTNSGKEVAEKILVKVGISETFDFKVFGDDVKKLKPDPETYKTALKLAGASAKEALAFEDSPTGAAAAENAGIDLIVIWDGVTSKGLFPQETIFFLQDFEGLANNLELTFEEAFRDFQKTVLQTPEEDVSQQTQKQPR